MAVTLPDEVDIGDIKLTPNTPFMYASWGIRYQFSPDSKQRVAEMAFSRKSDAENWMKDKFLNIPDMVADVIPVKRTLIMDNRGNTQSQTEELTDE